MRDKLRTEELSQATVHTERTKSEETAKTHQLLALANQELAANDSCAYPTNNNYAASALLQEIMKVPHYSVTRVADELNVSRVTISRLLHGSVRQASVRLFNKLLGLYCTVCFDRQGRRQLQ